MNKKDLSVKESLIRLFYLILTVASGIIIFNNAFFFHVDYAAKKEYPLPAIEAVLISILIIIAIIKNVGPNDFSKGRFPIAVTLVLFFLYQIWVSKNILFLGTVWDSGTILQNVLLISNGRLDFADIDYFSHYTYNDGLFLLEYIVAVIMRTLGHTDKISVLYTLTVIQSLASTVVAWLIYDILKKLHDESAGRLGLMVYILWFGLIGWQVVAYNDLTSFVFPIAAYDLYLRIDRTRPEPGKWTAIFILVLCGYKIKPTVLIVLIAIGMCEALHLITKKITLKRLRSYLSGVVMMAAVFILGSLIFSWLITLTPIRINKELNTGPLHMFMMGMNSENDGCFVISDVTYSFSYPTKKERTEAQFARINERFSNYTPGEFISFLSRKALVVFNDGTFAWGEESGFYNAQYTKGPLARLYKTFYYKSGSMFFIRQYIYQILWYMTLLLLTLTVKQRRHDKTFVLALSVTGIFIFDMLFEARARYLIVYVPIIMVLALHNLVTLMENRQRKLLSDQHL